MQIWEYALGGTTYEMEVDRKGKSFRTRKHVGKASKKQRVSFPLLRTCRKIYNEASLLPYQCNTFRFFQTGVNEWFSSLLPVQRDAIENVEIAIHQGFMLSLDVLYGPRPCSISQSTVGYLSKVHNVTFYVYERGRHGNSLSQEATAQMTRNEEHIVNSFSPKKVTVMRVHCYECLRPLLGMTPIEK